jgi:guanylate kinase
MTLGAMTQGPVPSVKRRGLMLVLSSPSGAGKTSIAHGLLDLEPELTLSVSVTTRPGRPGERNGVDYHFIDRTTYDTMVRQGELLEHAEVYDHGYGTPRLAVEAALSAGRDVLFDIDWQGTQQLREKARQDVVSVFILPPSAADLEKRLHTRAQDSDAVIRGRMSRASHEMSHWAEYDYIVINRSIDEAFAEVQAILKAERLRRDRRTGLTGFVRRLQKQLEN